MRLLPREQDRLLLFLAAELARKRRARGLLLNQAEAVALISDEVCEAARDGRSYAEAEAAGYAVLGPGDVAEGVAELVRRVEVEALFADGSGCSCCTTRSVDRAARARGGRRSVARADASSPSSTRARCRSASRRTSTSSRSTARSLRARAAWGMRLAISPGTKVSSTPGPAEGVPPAFEGARVIRGHAGLADGPLDAAGALEAALALARERGYRGA